MTNEFSSAPPPPPAPGPPVRRPTGTGSLVWGIVLVVVSLFNLPRGISLTLLSIVRPDAADIGTSIGILAVGVACVWVGIWLIVRSSRIRRANREALAQAYAAGPYYGQQPQPPYPQQQQYPPQPGQQQPPAPGQQPPPEPPAAPPVS